MRVSMPCTTFARSLCALCLLVGLGLAEAENSPVTTPTPARTLVPTFTPTAVVGAIPPAVKSDPRPAIAVSHAA